MLGKAVVAAPPATHIAGPNGAIPSIWFRNFAFDRVGTLWQCRAERSLLNLKWGE
jgi:hypothetical protein